MPDVEYSSGLLVSSVLWGKIWVWPFLFIDWRRFCLPLLNGSGCVMQQEAVTWHFAPSRDLWGKNEDSDVWPALPQHISVNVVKLGKVYIKTVTACTEHMEGFNLRTQQKGASSLKHAFQICLFKVINWKSKVTECIFCVLPFIYSTRIVIIPILSFPCLFFAVTWEEVCSWL